MPEVKAALTLEIDADANPHIGAGHLMRCAALAEAWLDLGFGAVRFTGAVDLAFAAARVEELMNGAPSAAGASTVLLSDSYDPIRRERAALRDDVQARVLVDDLCGAIPEGFDAVWNPSPSASLNDYPGFAGAVLAGPDVLPIRAGLPRWSGHSGATAVLLGGGRPLPHVNTALALLAARCPTDDFVRVGAWMPDSWSALDPVQPWEGIAQCGALLTGAGATLWEAALVRMPCAVMLLAENQRRGYDWAVAAGVPGIDAIALTSPDQLADRIVVALAAAIPLPPMRSGTARVARWIGALAVAHRPDQAAIRLRPALPSDAYTLWVWANDAATRAASFDRPPIGWEGHREWIARQLGDPGVLMLIAESGDHQPLGVIRFDADHAWTRARVSYGLAERVRGQGLGTTLVRGGFEALRALHPQAAVLAEVSPVNIPSLRIFRKLGWDESSHADRITFEIAGRE